jgi:hypothetical protein
MFGTPYGTTSYTVRQGIEIGMRVNGSQGVRINGAREMWVTTRDIARDVRGGSRGGHARGSRIAVVYIFLHLHLRMRVREDGYREDRKTRVGERERKRRRIRSSRNDYSTVRLVSLG